MLHEPGTYHAMALHPMPFDTLHCSEPQAPSAIRERSITIIGKIPYTEGLPCEPRTLLPGYDTGVMCMLIVLFLIITANFRHYTTFIKTFAQNLFSVRNRANAFDEHHTMSETRVLISLIMLVCVCEGILMFSALSLSFPITDTFLAVGSFTALTMLYYMWQLVIYRMVGYAFTSHNHAIQWIKGFNASQSLLGIILVIPALLVLFNPGIAPLCISIGILLYFIARIIFIAKGFRIFYNNSFSLMYFILYLCSLEIIPPILMYKTALFLIPIL